jgi:hypothetical protein
MILEADGAGGNTLTPGGTFDLPVTVTNRFGGVSASLSPAPLGSARTVSRSIGRGEQHVYEVTVPKGSNSLRAVLTEAGGSGADLDLYLFDCTVPEEEDAEPPVEKDQGNKAPPPPPPSCSPKAKAGTVDGGGVVEVQNPAQGRWVIVVDAFAAPGEGTTYSLLDVFTHPRFGAVAVTDFEDSREPGASWPARAHGWAAALPDGDRSLSARLFVTSREVKTNTGVPIILGTLDLPLGAAEAPSEN